jgi:hypothetical protein
MVTASEQDLRATHAKDLSDHPPGKHNKQTMKQFRVI